MEIVLQDCWFQSRFESSAFRTRNKCPNRSMGAFGQGTLALWRCSISLVTPSCFLTDFTKRTVLQCGLCSLTQLKSDTRLTLRKQSKCTRFSTYLFLWQFHTPLPTLTHTRRGHNSHKIIFTSSLYSLIHCRSTINSSSIISSTTTTTTTTTYLLTYLLHGAESFLRS